VNHAWRVFCTDAAVRAKTADVYRDAILSEPKMAAAASVKKHGTS
jgi:hypothetical protein